jgi:hypothetical protein
MSACWASTETLRKKKVEISARKTAVAADLPEQKAWPRSVIYFDPVSRHQTKSNMPIGRSFSQIVAHLPASSPQLWHKCDYAQGTERAASTLADHRDPA